MQSRIQSVLTERKIGVFVIAILVANVLFGIFEKCWSWSMFGLITFYNSHRTYDTFRVDPLDYVSPLDLEFWHVAHFMIRIILLLTTATFVYFWLRRQNAENPFEGGRR